ncbi:outer membrane protein [Bartonella sp. CB74]|uniref:outer membrane protein n=1 Tax=Bartonella sp. CB74 TaxID=3113620 RepID=UPI002F969AB2
MKLKYLITASVVLSASAVQAADVVLSHQPERVALPVSTDAASPSFSWAGFYFGGQVGGFSSKVSAFTPDKEIPLFPNEDSKNKKWVPLEKKYVPEPSGFIGGFYAGANVDSGNGFILGVETDVLLSGRKNTKTITITSESDGSQIVRDESGENSGASKVSLPVVGDQREAEDRITFSHTLKQKWTGATRGRVGFSAGRIMPYVSGGIAYGQFQDTLSVSITGDDSFSSTLDDTKTMIGYAIGGGVDFAITDDVIVRAEYRYSDFGKKKFGDEMEIGYKTNDFRVGVAYKF